MKEDTKRIVFAVVVPIIVVAIILGLGWILQNNVNVEEERISGVEDLYGTYTENPLTFTEKKITVNGNENAITYVQISGLKDISIQNSINEEIESLAKEYYNNYNTEETCYFYAFVSANFSNVLSINANYYKDDRILFVRVKL